MLNKFYNLGFAFDSIGRSQDILHFGMNANRILEKDYHVSISAFYDENDMPCIPLNFSKYYTSYAHAFSGHLFSCSFNVVKSVCGYSLPKHYYYIQDIEYERPWISKDIFNQVMHDQDITKIFRCEDHYKKFYYDGYKFDKLIVENFDIQKLLEIIDEGR